MRKTINRKDKPTLLGILAEATKQRQRLTALLAQGDVNEEQFKLACDTLAKCVIAQAAVNSLEVMK